MTERFTWTGQVSDIDAAVRSFGEAVDLTAAGEPKRAGYLSNLASALHHRFRASGNPDDLKAAVERAEESVRAAPADYPARPDVLSNLATIRFTRFERSGSDDDLDAVVAAAREAADSAPDDHPNRAAHRNALGTALRARFERKGNEEDLADAVTSFQRAADAAPGSHPYRGAVLANLGIALQVRFERRGDQRDLDRSIKAGREAESRFPSGHPHRATVLSNLGTALRARFVRTGALDDVTEAVRHLREAARLTPPGDHQRGLCWANLSAALYARFERTGTRADLDEAVDSAREGVAATASTSPNAASRLSALGIELRTRFERFGGPGDLSDLDEAIRFSRRAVDAASDDSPHRAGYLANLAAALGTRAERGGGLEDVQEAVATAQAAEAATGPEHPNRALRLHTLGNNLALRAERLGADADRQAAVAAWLAAAGLDTAAPSIRIRAARSASAALSGVDPVRAADAAEQAVLLLPSLTSLRLTAGDQQHSLGAFAGLAGEAASLVLAGPGSDEERGLRALRLLEAGRGVLLSHILNTRSDLTDLQAAHPVLAARYLELRDLVERASGGGPTGADTSGTPIRQIHSGLADLHELAVRTEEVLDAIRRESGFHSFALPPETSELLAETADGPLVVFNVSRTRGDALLLRPDGVRALRLPGLTSDRVTEQISTFHEALGREGSPEERLAAQRTLHGVLRWLWDTAAGPVLDALGLATRHTGESPGSWPRLWWIPGGLLGSLPLHVAGHHTDPADAPDRRTVLDRVVSSYTPTVRALRRARERTRTSGTAIPAEGTAALAVVMPTTPGLPGGAVLEAIPQEVAALRSVWPDLDVLGEDATDATDASGTAGTAGTAERERGTGTPSELPTRGTVLARLPHYQVTHFACHAGSDPADPSRSGLLLHDHETGRLTVAALRPVSLDRARLAYLSACHTAVSEAADLMDESIHLVSALQLAGFPQVIGTLWQVKDAPAATMAAAFYRQVTSGPSAWALHRAVHEVRAQYPSFPSLWAAHLHTGA
ncbi:CHAT domain-containing protein [Streptomyces sp. NPDC003247]|uniref:CHAT domain-containing tetratricopeptide repeat protein n=1 Tax=Streptomyces sp. NPDC003247 TaxID=3364677 RepID=UPI0036CEF4D7